MIEMSEEEIMELLASYDIHKQTAPEESFEPWESEEESEHQEL